MPARTHLSGLAGLWPTTRKGERYITGARPPGPCISLIMEDAAAARRYDDELPPINLIRCRRGVPRKRQSRFPKQLAGLFVEGPELPVVVGRSYKHQPARGYDRAPVVLATRIFQA